MKTPSSAPNGNRKPTLMQSARLHPYLPHKEALVNAYLHALETDQFARARLYEQQQRLRQAKARLAHMHKVLAEKERERRALAHQLHQLEEELRELRHSEAIKRAKETIVRAWRRFVAKKRRGCREHEAEGPLGNTGQSQIERRAQVAVADGAGAEDRDQCAEQRE